MCTLMLNVPMPRLLAQMHEFLILFSDLGNEVQSQQALLRLDAQTAETQRILDDAVLRLDDVLNHPQINALLIIGDEERLLDAMDTAVRHYDHIEAVIVEVDQEFQLDDGEDEQNHDDDDVSAAGS